MNDTLYNQIGKGYNTTRTADPYIVSRLVDMLQPVPNGHYLDIGCGTGNYTAQLAYLGYNVTGIDPSETMLAEARYHSAEVTWIQAAAEQIPLPGGTFDGAIATLTTHHWSDPGQAFKELARVLKHGGRIVMLTFTPAQELGYWLHHYFPKMVERSAYRLVTSDVVLAAAADAGFSIERTEQYEVKPGLQDLFCYSGKHDPERYFDTAFRSGISSFALSPDRSEIENGLKQLRADIDSGHFDTIRQQYANDNGDYLFVVLKNNKLQHI